MLIDMYPSHGGSKGKRYEDRDTHATLIGQSVWSFYIYAKTEVKYLQPASGSKSYGRGSKSEHITAPRVVQSMFGAIRALEIPIV